MEFEENNVEIEGNSTRNLKKKHKKFFTRVLTWFLGFFGQISIQKNQKHFISTKLDKGYRLVNKLLNLISLFIIFKMSYLGRESFSGDRQFLINEKFKNRFFYKESKYFPIFSTRKTC